MFKVEVDVFDFVEFVVEVEQIEVEVYFQFFVWFGFCVDEVDYFGFKNFVEVGK